MGKAPRAKKLRVPLWMSGFYGIFTFAMVPWIWHLLCTIPGEHMGMHWRLLWGVFDTVLFVNGFVVTYLLAKKSAWACLPLATLATLFAMDMWFDYMTSVTAAERVAAVKITIVAEIPLTILTLSCAIYILRQVTHRISQR